MNNWFQALNKPNLTPPAYIFPIAWTILYSLIAIAFILYVKGCCWKDKTIPVFIFLLQLLFNLMWSPVFFGMYNMKLAFVIVLIMIALTSVTIYLFYQNSKVAALLLVPYLLWIIFAAYLNFKLILLNQI